MNSRRHMYYDRKRADYMSEIRHKCECGHTVFVPMKLDFIYCDWCSRKVYRDEKTEFIREMLLKLGKAGNEQILLKK